MCEKSGSIQNKANIKTLNDVQFIFFHSKFNKHACNLGIGIQNWLYEPSHLK